jgi:hypothetical protein
MSIPTPAPILKRRRLLLDGGSPVPEACLGRLRQMFGVVALTYERDSLTVEYDLRWTSLTKIEALAIADGIKFRAGFSGIRRALWKFAERNELDNAVRAGSGACCSRPPGRG